MRAALLSVLCLFASVEITFAADSSLSTAMVQAFKTKNFSIALDKARLILKTEPNNLSALEVAAKSLSKGRQYLESAEMMDRYIVIKPMPVQVYFTAYNYFRAKRHKEASRLCEKCLSLDPNFGPVYLLKAEIVKDTNGFTPAYFSELQKAEQCNCQDPSFKGDLADALKIANEWKVKQQSR